MIALRKAAGVLLLAAAVAAAGIASARELTEAEKGTLAEAVASFDAAMGAEDIESTMAAVPPLVFVFLAERANVAPDAYMAAAIADTERLMEKVAILSHGMDIGNATFRQTPDGVPYALIPTDAVMEMADGGKTYRKRSETLAMLEGGTWYFVDAPTFEMVKQVYPSYAAETVAVGTMEAVQ